MNIRTMLTTPKFLLLVCLSIMVFSCSEEDSEVSPINGENANELPDFYLTNNLMDCPSEIFDLSEISFQINQAYQYNDLILGGGFSDLVIFNTATDEITEIDTIGVNQFLEYNGQLMICAEEGLFSFDAQQNITREASTRCYSVLIDRNDNFLMAGNDNRILRWNETEGETFFTDSQTSGFLDMDNLIELRNGELWTTTGDGKIVRFQDGLFIDFFDTNNTPLEKELTSNTLFMETYEEGVILVGKNGPTYQILKYTNNQEWVVLYQNGELSDSEKSIETNLPSLTDILIRENKLYISTSLAGCKGFQIFDITKNELLSSEDYDLLVDPNFTFQCINGLDYGADGDIFTISDNNVLFYDCN